MKGVKLVKVENVSKKFCRSLRRSLWYGVQDIGSELLGRSHHEKPLRRNEFWGVNDVSFALEAGDCLGLIGPNGAGKSTLLRMLNGLIKPDRGSITIKGRVGALIELGAGFNPILTARENIYVNGAVLGFRRREIDRRFDAIVDFADLEEFLDTPVRNFSTGMAVRLGFAIAAQMEPDVLLIDEVLAVGDAGFRGKCYRAIEAMSQRAAIVFVSHSMPAVSRVSSQVMVMDSGRAVYRGPASRAIDEYFRLFSFSTGGSVICHPDIEIREMTLLPGGIIESGDEMTLALRVDSRGHLEGLAIGVSILDRDQTPVCQIASQSADRLFSIGPGSNVLSVRVPSLQLNPGIYGISVTIDDTARRQTLCWDHLTKKLAITGDFYGNSPYLVKGEWFS